MKIVITGATGNVGTSLIEAAGEIDGIEQIVGIARRRPEWSPPKTEWVEADVTGDELEPLFADAGAVVHLAWAIQPSRDEALLKRINVDGSRRVFEAVRNAAVPRLVYASSVGAYSEGPKDRAVDESWPTGGIETSFYSRHKAAVERILDEFERSEGGSDRGAPQVVRLRPALIFKSEAASEIRRLFAGPFLPERLVDSRFIPVVPRIAGLRFQAVHSADVGRAYALACLSNSTGAFNIAADPPIGPDELASVLDARTVPVPATIARALTQASWKLRLQPSPVGWVDMALGVPIMSSERAHAELGWEPRHDSLEALEDLLEGIRHRRGHRTPPMEPPGPGGKVQEVRTGVGGRQWTRRPEETLIKHLTDVHSVEVQALVQMRRAPDLAGDDAIAEAFRDHLAETEGQEHKIAERLRELGHEPSPTKDVAGWAGGAAMLGFAASQPDTPGKLTAHAFAYENMEVAAYELLRRIAEQSGDDRTAAVASEIGDQEREMADRLYGLFDRATQISVDAFDGDGGAGVVGDYLADAHAIEQQSENLLETVSVGLGNEELSRVAAGHLEQTRHQEARLEERLGQLGREPSAAKDAMLAAGGSATSIFLGAQPDTGLKASGFMFAFEHLEIAAYELLKRAAELADDPETAVLAGSIAEQERAAADAVARTWDGATAIWGAGA